MPIRPLRAEELAEVELVFSTGLDVTQVRVNENASLPNWVGYIGAKLRGLPPPENNAITLFNTCYFPVTLNTNDPNNPLWLRDMAWLMHELTHAWQYQHDGIIYLYQAVFKSPTYVYAPAGQAQDDALKGFSKAGKVFRDFNREQQGDIVRDYYFFLKQQRDVSAWDAYLKELRELPAHKERPRTTSR
jgi:type VI secretion system secreted protein VgrG